MDKSATHWARAGEAGSMLGMKLLLIIYRLSGRWGFRIFLYPVMTYFYLVRGEARRASAQYLEKISGENPDVLQEQSSFSHFLMFGEIILDKFLVWMGEIGKDDVVFENPEEISAFDQNREGGVIIVSHLGNNEVCSALAEYLPKIQLTLLVYTQHAENFNALIKKFSGDSRIKVCQVTDMSPIVAMKLSDRVKAGEYVVIAGDRTPISGQQRASQVSFFGDKAALPQGAFILAGLLECPVYLLFCLKQRKKYHVYIERFAAQIKLVRGQRRQQLDSLVQQYADRLQYYCMKAPLQWFNFFPFWLSESLDSKEYSDDPPTR